MTTQDLKVFSGLIGVVMGFLYGVSGFADSGKVNEFSKNPRVKNLVWLIGGAGGVFFADWKILSGGSLPDDVRGILTLTYAECAVATAMFVIVGISVFVFVNTECLARRMPFLVGRSGELVLEYITYGYRAYRTRLEKLEAGNGAMGTAVEALSAVGSTLSVLLSATALDRSRRDAHQRELFIDQALEAIESTVKLFAIGVPGLELRTNFMVLKRHDQLAEVRLRFAPVQPRPDFRFLILRRYRDGNAEAFAIPVANASEALLPGAPIAAAEGKACILNPKKLFFRKGVPRATETEVKAFFREVGYASVISVPLIWERAVVGVVNVESNHVELVGKGPDTGRRIGLALAPFSVILGELVHRAEEYGDAL